MSVPLGWRPRQVGALGLLVGGTMLAACGPGDASASARFGVQRLDLRLADGRTVASTLPTDDSVVRGWDARDLSPWKPVNCATRLEDSGSLTVRAAQYRPSTHRRHGLQRRRRCGQRTGAAQPLRSGHDPPPTGSSRLRDHPAVDVDGRA